MTHGPQTGTWSVRATRSPISGETEQVILRNDKAFAEAQHPADADFIRDCLFVREALANRELAVNPAAADALARILESLAPPVPVAGERIRWPW